MRHRKNSKRLARPLGARRAMMRNLVIALLKYQEIKTTKAKAKLTQRFIDRLITLGKKDGLQARRHAYKLLQNRETVQNLFNQIAPLFKGKNSGFSRILQLSNARDGDGAQMVLLQLTEKQVKATAIDGKKEKAQQAKTVSSKPEKSKSDKLKEEKQKPERTKPTTTIEEKHKLPKEKIRPPKKQLKPKKFLGGLRNLFKKERDSL